MKKDHEQSVNGSNVLPPFYKSITPLFSTSHERLRLGLRKNYSFAADATGIVLTAEEFPSAERDYPIVFSKGERVMPVALTGVPGTRNQFVSKNGKWRDGTYVPAYILRYPFILAKMEPDAKDLTLCFDSESGLLREAAVGNLFLGDQPSERTKAILKLCEWFEAAIAKTEAFVEELTALDLLMDAQASIRIESEEPTLFHGFQVVSEEKYKNIPDAELRRLAKSGALVLIHAHLFSLKNIERLFLTHHQEQSRQGAVSATAA